MVAKDPDITIAQRRSRLDHASRKTIALDSPAEARRYVKFIMDEVWLPRMQMQMGSFDEARIDNDRYEHYRPTWMYQYDVMAGFDL